MAGGSRSVSVRHVVLESARCHAAELKAAAGARFRRAALSASAAALLLTGCASAAVVVPEATAPVPPSAPSPAASAWGHPWVDPSRTGVPPGMLLRPSDGLTVAEDGAVVDGLDIRGCVTVAARGVTIRNSRITCADPAAKIAVRVEDGAEGLVVEHSEIDGGGLLEVGVGWSGYTLRGVNIHGVNDGVRFGHRVTIEDSWIHDMARIGELHPDAVQTTSASEVVIRGNVLDPRHGDSGDLTNAAIMLGSETGTQKVVGVLIENNLLSGGNYSLNVRADIDADGVVIRGNTFGGGARYGAVIAPPSVPLGEANVDASGAPVSADRAR